MFFCWLLQVTIAPRAGRELGYVRLKMDHVKFDEGMLRSDSVSTLDNSLFKAFSATLFEKGL